MIGNLLREIFGGEAAEFFFDETLNYDQNESQMCFLKIFVPIKLFWNVFDLPSGPWSDFGVVRGRRRGAMVEVGGSSCGTPGRSLRYVP